MHWWWQLLRLIINIYFNLYFNKKETNRKYMIISNNYLCAAVYVFVF